MRIIFDILTYGYYYVCVAMLMAAFLCLRSVDLVWVFGLIDSIEGNVLEAKTREQSCEAFGLGCD